jgi:acyl-CoA thioester hydrolase
MNMPMPPAGVFSGALHQFPVRIYYEDTDISGLVYHANYLRYMERARSDWIGQLGMDQRGALENTQRLFFVVRGLAIDYLKPAHLGDALIIQSNLIVLGGASMTLQQRIWRAETQLIDATVRIAFVGGDGKPKRLPNQLREAMSTLLVA